MAPGLCARLARGTQERLQLLFPHPTHRKTFLFFVAACMGLFLFQFYTAASSWSEARKRPVFKTSTVSQPSFNPLYEVCLTFGVRPDGVQRVHLWAMLSDQPFYFMEASNRMDISYPSCEWLQGELEGQHVRTD